jgi:uncharacterized 2Fe-2S/4Fe-4S cluster protein (DUF4445 family)
VADQDVAIRLEPSGKTVPARPGTPLVEVAAAAGIVLDLPCGGEGACGKCRVRVPRDASPPNDAERKAFSTAELAEGYRLACQSVVAGPTTVEIPETSLLASYHKIMARTRQIAHKALDPAVRKQYVELTVPRRGDDAPDLVRLMRVLGPLELDPDLLRELPGRLRKDAFRGTAVMADGTLVDWEPGDTTGQFYAVAIDIGTTTLVASLLDLVGGEPMVVASRLNPQTRFGDDVLTRILHGKTPEGLADLRDAIVDAVNEMIGELAAGAGLKRQQIYEVVFSGNTTMQQLVCGIDPTPLGEVPFVPTIGGLLWLRAASLGIDIHPRARAVVMPVIGGFVGGDTVAGMLATAMADATGPTLLVDIGTNGEIVLAVDGKLSAASTAAGPAFEGARIQHGMRGSVGAIERVAFDGELHLGVIGNVAPVGICGSALIDLGAELLRHKLVTPEGRLLPADQLPADVPADLARRASSACPATFLVAEASQTGIGKPIVLTQRDVRELQLATGAIRAGIRILLKRAGLAPADLATVLVAGGFGNYIRRSSAQRIGLLPPEIESSRIRYQGNTSLAGAQMAAFSRTARELADDLARRTEHVDLSQDPGFLDAFADAMLFGGE